MSRSVKKGPYVHEKLLKRVEALNAENKKTVLKTYNGIPDTRGIDS